MNGSNNLAETSAFQRFFWSVTLPLEYNKIARDLAPA